MAYLASRPLDSNVGFEAATLHDSFWLKAELGVWERKTTQWVHDLIRQDRHEEALTVLRTRHDRPRCVRLLLLEARAPHRPGPLGRKARHPHDGLAVPLR